MPYLAILLMGSELWSKISYATLINCISTHDYNIARTLYVLERKKNSFKVAV
jgi:hypothetical protein